MDQPVQKKQLPKQVYMKAILMGIALLLLVAALIFFTAAWYTKMVSTAGIDLQAAKWDYTANHTIDDVMVNVYEYGTLENNRAAPGTEGWIPILLGARQAETNIKFTLTVDRSTMSQEFRDRIFFYYYDEEIDPYKTTKIYFGGSPSQPANTDIVEMRGEIPRGGTESVTVYWEWVYEATDILGEEATQQQITAWDEFDTKVGKNPELYATDMSAKVVIAGVEVRPAKTNK